MPERDSHDVNLDVNELGHGELLGVDTSIFAGQLEDEVELARSLGVEAHTTIRDTEGAEHHVELTNDIESIESEGRNTRIWLKGAGIATAVTATGAAVVAAIAVIRHRRKS